MNEAGATDADEALSDFGGDLTRDDRVPRPIDYETALLTRQRRVMAAVVASFALLAGACVIAGIVAWRDIQVTEALVDARQARGAGILVSEALLVAESGQRGYLLTRDPAYLASYDMAKSDFVKSLAELQSRLAGDTSRAPMIAAVARIANEKFDELDRTIALGRAGRFDDAAEVVRSGAGKSMMDDIRHTVDDLNAGANAEVTRATATQTRMSTVLIGAIVIALICVAGLGVVLLIDVRRQLGLLQNREAGVRQLAEILESRVVERTRELAQANQRFEAALRASGVTVMTQDRDLVFTWASQGLFGQPAAYIVGKAQRDVTPEGALTTITNLKRGVVETGDPARGDVRVMQDGAERWYDLTVHPLSDERGAVTGIIAGAIDITRYKEQEARIRLLMRELTHRSKNLLTVIQAIMRQTASNSTSLTDFETRFSARLHSLAGSHDLLVREDWQGASLGELVRSQLGHYGDRVGSQIELSGEEILIPPDAAQHIGMAMHELATNAAKYGALSTPEGKVRVAWHMEPGADGAPMCHLSWEESGGPIVEPPAVRGFGRVVIERTVARALLGEVTIDYAPSGLRWTLVFPERRIASA